MHYSLMGNMRLPFKDSYLLHRGRFDCRVNSQQKNSHAIFFETSNQNQMDRGIKWNKNSKSNGTVSAGQFQTPFSGYGFWGATNVKTPIVFFYYY